VREGPKKAQSAYMFYCAEQRPKLKADNPDLSFSDLGKQLGSDWKELDSDAKAPYEEQAKKDKKRFEDEGGVTKKTAKKRKQEGPKRPLSAYMFFAQENRASIASDNPDAGFGELGKLVGQKWGELSTSDKAPYAKKNKEDKERYAQELADWEKEHGPLPKKQKKSKKAGKKKAKKAASDDDGDDGAEASGGDEDD